MREGGGCRAPVKNPEEDNSVAEIYFQVGLLGLLALVRVV